MSGAFRPSWVAGIFLDEKRELLTCKGFRCEKISLSGLGSNASSCGFNSETVSICGSLILWFLCSTVEHFVIKIPLRGHFIEKVPTFPSPELLSFKKPSCYCSPRMRLSSSVAAGRGSLRSGSRGEVSGQLGLGEDVAQFASGKGMLSLGTLSCSLPGGFLVCSPGIIAL